jgi:heme-degrading monooxygenase HmoA
MDYADLFRRREDFLQNGIPRYVYVQANARAHELRRMAFARAFGTLLRAIGWSSASLTRACPTGVPNMIIREWRGRAALSKADDYPKHFQEKVIPGLRRLAGFVGVHLIRRRLEDRVEFVALTRWQSMDAIRGFTGPDVTKAIVDPAGAAALIEFDKVAQHYEVVADAASA